MLIIFPASSQDAFSAARQFALSVHVIKILIVKTLLSVLLPMINWIRMPLSKDKIHSCSVRCYNLKHVVRGVDR